MHRPIVLGVAAWLLGASAATGGSLLAVSVLGQGMTPGAEEQQGVATVNRALAKEAAERTAARARHAISPSKLPTARHSPAGRDSAPPPSPNTTGGTVLTSQGGTLVASCAGARAYLVSWSPQQGFGSGDVVRGPATNAQVMFTGGQLTVTMIVSCDSGVPTAAATAVTTRGDAVSRGSGDGE